ncbi:MAG: M48 family metallopeptidase [Putridiphycobacter sp.]
MKRYVIIALAAGLLSSCSLFKKNDNDVPNGGLNLFTIEQDKQLGKQVADEIAANPTEYPVLDSASNVAAYQYIYKIRNTILNTGKVEHKDDFAWQIKIIKDDSTLNAFCTPGGYIYVYTGIIKFLDNEAELAGVMGHEMGHADLRHSTRQMTKMYGIELLVSAALGERAAIKQITSGLIGLKFSRSHETEADRMSVEYLCPTDYVADGGAGFFEKIEAMGGQQPPEFLSTHPSPDNRIENFHTWAKENNCPGTQTYVTNYEAFKRLF